MLYDEIISREAVDKGWSGDQKYHIRPASGPFQWRHPE